MSAAESGSRLRDAVAELVELDVAPIVQAGDPVLRHGALPFDGQLDDAELTRLIELMTRTMRAAPGVGLAAPQIGLPLAIAVIEDPGPTDPEVAEARERDQYPFRVLVNPAYEAVGDERAWFYEGCLSVQGWAGVVGRARAVHLTGLDEYGVVLDEEVTGWPARIVQHETDHLLGVLYIDRAETRSLATGAAAAHWANDPHPHAAARALGFELD
ncbi:MAG: peptide deformylase [Actinomycetales bacterium]|nr:peptide deformylase [Actinomycetales bacterium]